MCRKREFEQKYGKEVTAIITGGWIVCPVCKTTHSPNEDIPFEEENTHEKQIKVS